VFPQVLAAPSGSEKKKSAPAKSEVRPRYRCDLCNLRFVAQRNLYLHLKDHYEPGKKNELGPLTEVGMGESCRKKVMGGWGGKPF
jgi:hypothetical protein